jgi:glycosyltransferase involved in cell wall biosynthesis
MRIVFYDRTPVDYTPETPFLRPLGGSESAQCYLSIELAARGHSVALVTNTSSPGGYRRVQCSNHHDQGTLALLKSADIIVASNESLGRSLKDRGVDRPMVLWIGHAQDQPAIKGLESSRERKAWAGFAFVSQWQQEKFTDEYWVPVERSRVMRNAVSPGFLELAPGAPWYERGLPPVLVYTSQPYRGLDVLLDAFPAIRAAIPEVRLKVFSSFASTYATPLAEDPHAALYRRCDDMDGAEYVGAIAQPALAGELSSAAALAYPSTFYETSCIAVLEAMAAGLTVCTTRLGALPETTAGFARMVEPSHDRTKLAPAFAAATIAALSECRERPETVRAQRERQIAYVRENYAWPKRAQEWEAWLSEIVARFVA